MRNSDLLYLSREDIKNTNISMKETINIVEQTYIAHAFKKVYLPAKIGIHPNNSDFFHAMPAMVTSPKSAGVKWVSYFPSNNAEKKHPDSSCIMILNDVNTGLPICIMEALHLTYMRTAASAAIAAKRLANPNARILSIIGAGTIARWAVRAIISVIPTITEIRVTSRTEKSRDRFCTEMSEIFKEVNFSSYNDIKSLISDSDIALSITSNSGEPFIEFDWLKKGTLALALDGVISWDHSFTKADYIVTDDEVYLQAEIKRKHDSIKMDNKIHEISEIIDSCDSQWSRDKRSIAFMNGIGSTDITLGKYIYDQAVEKNFGITLPFS